MRYLFFCLLFISIGSCTTSTRKDVSYDSDIIELNLDEVKMEDSILASSIFASVKPILLETTEESMIGEIDGIQVIDSLIFILDKNIAKSLFIFNKDGSFIRKLGKLGNGPGEYLDISDFTIDKANEKIYTLDPGSEKINVYDLRNGRFIKQLPFKDENASYTHIQYEENRLYVDAFFYKRMNSGPILYVLDAENGTILSKWLDIATHNCGWNESITKDESFFFCKNIGTPKYCQYFMDTIMTVNSGTVKPYLVVKSKEWVTKDIIPPFSSDEPMSEVFFKINERPVSMDIHNYVESEKYIFFKFTNQNKIVNLIYDKKDKRVRYTKRLLDDLLLNKAGWFGKAACCDEQGVYSNIPMAVMPSFAIYLKEQSSNIKSDDIRNIADYLNPESNPLILYYKFKK